MKTLKDICESLVKGNANKIQSKCKYTFDVYMRRDEPKYVYVSLGDDTKKLNELLTIFNNYDNYWYNDIMEVFNDIGAEIVLISPDNIMNTETKIDENAITTACVSKNTFEHNFEFLGQIPMNNFTEEYWRKNNWKL